VPAETTAVTLTALSGIPAIQPGDDIAAILAEALAATRREVRDGDVLVVSPVRERKRRAKVKELVAEAHEQYGGVFKRLAE